MVGDTGHRKGKRQRGVACNRVIPAHTSWREDGDFKTSLSYVETLSQKKRKNIHLHVKDLAPRAERRLQKRVVKKYPMLLKEGWGSVPRTHLVLTAIVTPVLGNMTSAAGLRGHQKCMWHTHMLAGTHAGTLELFI